MGFSQRYRPTKPLKFLINFELSEQFLAKIWKLAVTIVIPGYNVFILGCLVRYGTSVRVFKPINCREQSCALLQCNMFLVVYVHHGILGDV